PPEIQILQKTFSLGSGDDLEVGLTAWSHTKDLNCIMFSMASAFTPIHRCRIFSDKSRQSFHPYDETQDAEEQLPENEYLCILEPCEDPSDEPHAEVEERKMHVDKPNIPSTSSGKGSRPTPKSRRKPKIAEDPDGYLAPMTSPLPSTSRGHGQYTEARPPIVESPKKEVRIVEGKETKLKVEVLSYTRDIKQCKIRSMNQMPESSHRPCQISREERGFEDKAPVQNDTLSESDDDNSFDIGRKDITWSVNEDAFRNVDSVSKWSYSSDSSGARGGAADKTDQISLATFSPGMSRTLSVNGRRGNDIRGAASANDLFRSNSFARIQPRSTKVTEPLEDNMF
ncbi:hypothetical protein BaRGS_00035234, partial [Batillaria attramentaria]